MTTFTIDPQNNVVAHAAALDKTPENQQAFASEKELDKLAAGWGGQRLIELWNSFAGVTPFDDLKPVKKFTNRKAAVRRIWQAVQRLAPAPANGAKPEGVAASGISSAELAATKPAPAPKAPKGASKKGKATKETTPRKKRVVRDDVKAGHNKKAEVIAMMKRAKGATLAEIMETTGWQRHTVRGFISILGSKGGEKIESSKNAAGERTYRIAK
ncbi:MAG TPA: DUF3489 domain-containing protein [Bryobacteraceae bacterium]